jgi:UDP-glucuronate 4-epimerase
VRILLTGGAGFIGSHLAERLLERGETLSVLDSFDDFYDPRAKERNIEQVRKKGELSLYRADLRDDAALRELFRAERPEAVIHLAARAGVRPSFENPQLYASVNISGTTTLLGLVREFGVQHFVFGSSSSVYGVNSSVPFKETDPVGQPISPYAVSKRAGELLAFTYHYNYEIPVTCLRFFTVYGPRQRPDMAIHKFSHRIRAGDEIALYAQGRSSRDYTYVDDIVDGILAALAAPAGFQIFNLGDSRGVALTDLIGLLEKALGKRARVCYLPAQEGDVPLTLADISLARERLGYAPSIAIEEGIPRFVEWFLSES